MSCEERQNKLEAYLDGELTLSDQRDIEQHLADCGRCSAMLSNLRTLSASVKKIDQVNAPAALRRNIQRGLKEMTGESQDGFSWAHLLGVGGGSAVLASALVWAVMSTTALPLPASPTDELVAAHVRSMMVSHLTDVASSDQHTVKPWFNGKLDFSPTVMDLQKQGFPLVGGRLDYLQKQPVAALVYRHRAHFINVFIRRGESAAQSSPTVYAQQQGYHLISWRKAGMDYALVSDLNHKELQEFAGLLESQAAPK